MQGPGAGICVSYWRLMWLFRASEVGARWGFWTEEWPQFGFKRIILAARRRVQGGRQGAVRSVANVRDLRRQAGR